MLLEIETLTLLQGLTLGLGGFIVGCLAGLSGIGGGILRVQSKPVDRDIRS